VRTSYAWAATVFIAVHLTIACGTERGSLSMTSSNAPVVPPVRAPKTTGDWVVERWSMQRTETRLEGWQKGRVDLRPQKRLRYRFTRTDEDLGRGRVEIHKEPPEAAAPEIVELSPRATPSPDVAVTEAWLFAHSVDAFPIAGNDAIRALCGRVLSLEGKSPWRVEPTGKMGIFTLRYESAPPTNPGPYDRTLQERFEGTLLLVEGLPRALTGKMSAVVSHAAFSGERQTRQVVDNVEVTWEYGTGPE
jgi:hypothetical protein